MVALLSRMLSARLHISILYSVLLCAGLVGTAPLSANGSPDLIAAFVPDLLRTRVYDQVIIKARELANEPYTPPSHHLPKVLSELTYDQYRSIRFRSESALWHGQANFELQLFHPGFLFNEPVIINEVANNISTPVVFRSDLFRYDGPAEAIAGEVPSDIGFAGFRVHYPLNNKEYKDEFLVFQGASYFRLVGPGQAYGLSARGLAIDTAEAKGEEFPVFREFWLERPNSDDNHLIIYALLDSKSITGAYRFDINPGASTEIKVRANLFARTDIHKLGIAPLTSMFMWGENRTRFHDDFRPEVHDSDGLLMSVSNGEWIWRPLSNNKQLHVSSLMDENPGGFGLLQRDRQFDHFMDMEANYQMRPSLWVTPEGNWGKGRVELVEIPSDSEANDNIVAYWVPEGSMIKGEHRSFGYSIRTFDSHLSENPYAHVLRTHIGWAAIPAQHNPPPKTVRRFMVDFRGGGLENFSAGAAITAKLQVFGGETSDVVVQRLADATTWRVSFILKPEANQPSDMRLYLQLGDRRLSEVWSYVWYADAID